MSKFVDELRGMINARKKMTSPLYQVILSGKASQVLLQAFVIHRYPIKNFWTRNILGVAARVEDYPLRCALVENIYEEESGYLTRSKRHLDSFEDFGISVGVTKSELLDTPWLPETRAVIEHNLEVCNGVAHFTSGIASVLLLMEGQPPIVSENKKSMLSVMRDVYGLPREGYDYFVHHASSQADAAHVSELEEDHAHVAAQLIDKYCFGEELQTNARRFLSRAIERRHAHFDAIYRNFHRPTDVPFRYVESNQLANVQ
jgi:pyrroloquinoline-quinone synthase